MVLYKNKTTAYDRLVILCTSGVHNKIENTFVNCYCNN